jgi:pyridoxamine 5'-phosphate oxidase
MTHNEQIAALRKDYRHSELLESEVDADPIMLFHLWFKQAIESEITEPNAMCLSTIADGKPESRIVLLKGIEHHGFVFYTNYNSHKGQQIEQNANVHLNFAWLELERQIRIKGFAQKISRAESDLYFASRPFESRVGAIVSAQSETVESRKVLEYSMSEALTKYQGTNPPRPEHWGGYVVIPEAIEFWQGRTGRLHDRLLYTKEDQAWKIDRLCP